MDSSNNSEAWETTRAAVEKIFQNLKIDKQIGHTFEDIRLGKQNPLKKNPPPIMVKFWTEAGKKLLYHNIKNKTSAKDGFVKDIKLSDVVPEFLKDDYFKAEKKGFEIRKEAKGTKTRTLIKDQKIVLLAKSPGDQDFNECDF